MLSGAARRSNDGELHAGRRTCPLSLAAEPSIESGADGAAGFVLVVDDTEENRYAVARWLERAGFRVALAGTGADALRLARDEVELVVLDVHLPDLHGFEVARKLKEDPRTSHVPVLHLSAKYVALADRVTGWNAAPMPTSRSRWRRRS